MDEHETFYVPIMNRQVKSQLEKLEKFEGKFLSRTNINSNWYIVSPLNVLYLGAPHEKIVRALERLRVLGATVEWNYNGQLITSKIGVKKVETGKQMDGLLHQFKYKIATLNATGVELDTTSIICISTLNDVMIYPPKVCVNPKFRRTLTYENVLVRDALEAFLIANDLLQVKKKKK